MAGFSRNLVVSMRLQETMTALTETVLVVELFEGR